MRTQYVLDRDGRPAAGVEVFAYHTDAGGSYAPPAQAAGENGLYGAVTRGVDGSQEVSYTIRRREHGNF